MRRISYLIGLSQSLLLGGYAIAIFIIGVRLESTLGSPVVESIIYLIFAAAIFFVSRGFARVQNWARTPYLVTQMFGLIVAYTLLAGDELNYRITGALVGLSSAVAIYALVKTPLEN